jgi:hypothetical protein
MCNCNPTSSTSSGNGGVISIGNCGVCQDGADGTSSYTYVAFADEVTDQCDPAYATSGFSLTATGTAQWIGIITTSSPLTPPEEEDFDCSWVQVAGAGVAGSIIEVQENGTAQVNDPNILNFIGAGAADVTVTSSVVGGNTVANITVDAKIFIPTLWADAIADLSSASLIPGATYWIYNVGDGRDSTYASSADGYAGILVKAIAPDKFSLDGAFIARVPAKTIPFWHNGGTYASSVRVENFNTVYKNNLVVAQGPSNTPPAAAPANWIPEDKKNNTYYETQIYSCLYDVINDQILKIVDNKNNEVSVTVTTGTSVNDFFLKCIKWSNTSMTNNKITVTNLNTLDKGYLIGTYPNLASVTGKAVNFAFWPYSLKDNIINIELGATTSKFTSMAATAQYAKFFNPSPIAIPAVTKNKFEYSDVILSDSTTITNCEFNKCKFALNPSSNTIGTNSTIADSIFNSVFFSNNNSCTLSNNDMYNCTISDNTSTGIVDVKGGIMINSNTDCSINLVTAHTRTTNASTYVAFNEIISNTDVLLQDISGQFFKINSNQTISVRFNIVLANAFIEENVGATSALVLQSDGITPYISGFSDREKCMIFSVNMSNQAAIRNNIWITSGALFQLVLNASSIQNLKIDFKDVATRIALAPDMKVDGVDAYLIQPGGKLTNYPCPPILGRYTADQQDKDNGIFSGTLIPDTRNVLPTREIYSKTVANVFNKIPLTYVSEDGYGIARRATPLQSSAYVFLNMEDPTIYSTLSTTLTLPAWTRHAGIFYLYVSTNVVIPLIIDTIIDTQGNLRSPTRYRFVALSDDLLVDFKSTAITGMGSNKIASSSAPSSVFSLKTRYDYIELEKQNTRYVVAEHVNVQ